MTATDYRMKRFFSRLSYSFGNEDWNTERQALQIKPGNQVLCISASGDRPLHLLLDDLGKLTSVDANPVQNYLLNLKCAALKTFAYDEYIGFLGGAACKNRKVFLKQLLPHMDEETAKFWSQRSKMINKGVLYQGSLEKFSKIISKSFSFFRPIKTKKIFNMKCLEEQREYLQSWDSYWFRKFFLFVLNPRLCRLFAIDPGLYVHADPSLGLGRYIYDRMIHSLHHSLAKDNLLFSLIFRGYIEPSAFPPYLHPEGSSIIRERLDRLYTKTADVVEHLEQTEDNTYDRYSLSDVASYLSRDNFDRLIKNIYRTARPGARFCIRQFSSNQQIPLEFETAFKRDTILEGKLEREDRCFVYRFIVGEIIK